MFTPRDVDVIIITYNRKEFLLQNLKKLEDQTHKNFNLIITDDGTKTPIDPSQYPIINKYIWAKDEGYHRTGSLNAAFKLVLSPNIIILDDDCIVQSSRYVEQHLLNLKDFPISRGIIYFPKDGGDANSWFSMANIGLRTSTLKAIGGQIDPNYDFHYGHEDQDVGEELKKAGFIVAAPYNNDTKVFHLGENYANNDRSDKIIKHNTDYFISKWAYDPRRPRPW